MAESPVPPGAIQLYYLANKKQQQMEEDINTAKMKYHCKMYKLGKIRECMVNHPLNSAVKDEKLKRKYDLYSEKADNLKQKYLALLSEERDGRESYIANINEAKKQFAWFERSRRLVIKSALKKYATILDILNNEREEHKRILLEVRNSLARMDVNLETKTLTQKHLMKCQFPVYEELDESVYKSSSPSLSLKVIRGSLLRWKKSWFRKKGAQNELFPETFASEDIQRNVLPDKDDSGHITYRNKRDGHLQKVVSDGQGEVSTSESESDPSKCQETKSAESAKDDREVQDNTNLPADKTCQGEKNE
ncbi:hypothetical protein ACJMK2_012490 [Sinanodonta woodiana]|uniref:Uncharacterized protein n=1 Tax=Sinanodonta woodiana TaxID=1069815 RepID=A0ABD3VBE6_SINWO